MSGLRLIRHCAEFLDRKQIKMIPPKTRGIYALLKEQPPGVGKRKYDVVYIGMSASGIRDRLTAHHRSKRKADLWSHFSVYSVWPNITDEEIKELEGLFRAIYRRDSTANSIAIQKGFRSLRNLRDDAFEWKDD